MKVPVTKTSLTNKKIMNNSIYSLAFISIILLGCAQPINHKLNVDIKNNNLCVYTDNTKFFSSNDSYYAIFIGEYNPTEKFRSIYNKVYKNKKFPIGKNDCLPIPSYVFKKDKIYRINIETNKNLSVLVCVSKKKSILSFKIMRPEDSSCITQ